MGVGLWGERAHPVNCCPRVAEEGAEAPGEGAGEAYAAGANHTRRMNAAAQ
jgi:hypothetical protein